MSISLSDIKISFDRAGDDESRRREILRNIENILLTPMGTAPLYRDFGIDTSVLDYPLDTAQSMLAAEVIDAIEKWEPRVQVQDVGFVPDSSGNLTVKVVIGNGESPEIRV